MPLNSDFQKLSVDGLITLFELDASRLGAGTLRFHGHNHDKNDVVITFFDNGNPTASDECKEQIWFVEQKTSENAQQVTFELSNPIDLEGLKIPVREITNYCHWAVVGKYRGEECGYTGATMFDEHDKPTDNPILDKCGGRMKSCVRRFGKNKPLPFGGCPASSLIGS
ncbi:phage minor tail protein L [Moraxella haemolytica]|uniref:phage minor tail protein L n=1 Tax=Moraxella haemolytica TaxID=2904119 RepID=UPI00254332A6|nr:phage minor tail protein L [Moraxella sp. ZY171148]WII94425.1 phage minor tail protein L [Moraxella sp. ZY171148]